MSVSGPRQYVFAILSYNTPYGSHASVLVRFRGGEWPWKQVRRVVASWDATIKGIMAGRRSSSKSVYYESFSLAIQNHVPSPSQQIEPGP